MLSSRDGTDGASLFFSFPQAVLWHYNDGHATSCLHSKMPAKQLLHCT